MLQVYDDALPKKLVDDLERLFLNQQIEFVFAPGTVDDDQVKGIPAHKNIVDTPQIVHMIYANNRPLSKYWPDIKSLLYFIEDKIGIDIIGIDRVKANLLTPHPDRHKNSFNMPHTDRLKEDQGITWLSIVYYVNDADGDTFLFDQFSHQSLNGDMITKRVSPKKGRFVIFESERWHASSNPTKKFRTVLNFVLAVRSNVKE